MVIKEWFTQTMEDLDGRFKNPLILSFILVWLCHNWRLPYMIFNFDEDYTLPQKMFQISEYLKQKTIMLLLVEPLLWSILSLIGFYLIGVFAQAIKLYLGKKLAAELMAKHDTGKYELKSVADNYYKRNKQYIKDNKEMQDQLNERNHQAEEDEKQIMELARLNDTYSKTISDADVKVNELKRDSEAKDQDIIKLATEKAEILSINEILIKEKAELVNSKHYLETTIEKNERLNSYSNSIKIDSDDLKDIFGIHDIWELYLNDKAIETFRYNDKTKSMETKDGKILITNTKISLQDNIILFEKNTDKFKNLKTSLIRASRDTLYGKEGSANRVKYVRTNDLIL